MCMCVYVRSRTYKYMYVFVRDGEAGRRRWKGRMMMMNESTEILGPFAFGAPPWRQL